MGSHCTKVKEDTDMDADDDNHHQHDSGDRSMNSDASSDSSPGERLRGGAAPTIAELPPLKGAAAVAGGLIPTIAELPPIVPNAAALGPPHNMKKRHLFGKAKRLKSSLFRVGSRAVRPPNYQGNPSDEEYNDGGGHRRTGGKLSPAFDNDVPHSPRARASTYSHVHDAVMYNLSEAEISKHDQSVPMGVVGLRNLGNTCFINSSLQCLSATIPLTDYFLGYDYRSEINKSNFLGTGGKLVVAYAELMKQMWLGSKSVVDPTDFKKQLGTFAPQFSGYHQHDTQELLAFLLDGIHEDLNRVKERPYIEDKDCDGTNDEIDAIQCWKNYLRRNKSLVVDLFQGQLKNTCQCLKCGHINIRVEPLMYLSLPITDKCKSVDDCIDLFLKEETLKGSDQWYCEKCKTHRDATKKIDLWILPPILIVHLKRFKYNDFGKVGSKNDASIKYPVSQWNLKSRVQSQGGVYPIYDLYAVSNHMGSLGGGHYTALALNRFDDTWYEFNDSRYTLLNGETAHKQNKQTKAAYVLFYNRSEGGDLSQPLNERSPMIRRQSVSRPDLWPHTQVDDRDKVRNFTRSSIRMRSGQQMDGPPIPKRNGLSGNRPRTGSGDHVPYHSSGRRQPSHQYNTRSRAGTDPDSDYHKPTVDAEDLLKHPPPPLSSSAGSAANNNTNNRNRQQLNNNRSRAGSHDDPVTSSYHNDRRKYNDKYGSGGRGSHSRSSSGGSSTRSSSASMKDPPGTRGGFSDEAANPTSDGAAAALKNGRRNPHSTSPSPGRTRTRRIRSPNQQNNNRPSNHDHHRSPSS